MRGLAVLSFVLVGALAIAQIPSRAPRKVPGNPKPECGKGSICFSGEVRDGQEFRESLNSKLDFVLRLPGGLDVVPKQRDAACDLWAWVAKSRASAAGFAASRKK